MKNTMKAALWIACVLFLGTMLRLQYLSFAGRAALAASASPPAASRPPPGTSAPEPTRVSRAGAETKETKT